MSSSSVPASLREPAVFDASPLVFLDVLGYAVLLPDLHRVLVPPAVVEELVVLPGEPGSSLPAKEWVERRAPGAETLRRVESEMSEGKGEKEAIALALDLSALVVLDGKRARSYARRVGLRLTATLGVLLRLHGIGLASRGLEEDLRLLEEAGMRITPELRRMVLDTDPGKRGENQKARSGAVFSRALAYRNRETPEFRYEAGGQALPGSYSRRAFSSSSTLCKASS